MADADDFTNQFLRTYKRPHPAGTHLTPHEELDDWRRDQRAKVGAHYDAIPESDGSAWYVVDCSPSGGIVTLETWPDQETAERRVADLTVGEAREESDG